jgi:ssDNA-binding replication factor A large subunit
LFYRLFFLDKNIIFVLLKNIITISYKTKSILQSWMQNLINNFYDKVKDLIEKDKFVNEIIKIKNDSDDLFDENICKLLLIDKLDRNDYSFSKISNLEPGMESTIFAKVSNIGDIREFQKKNGKKGRVVNLEIMDNSGICRLVLWDRDVDLIKNDAIELNSNIKIINGYVKKGLDGIEINIGRWSFIEIVEKNNYLFDNNLKNEKPISGRILEIMPTRPFFKNNGEYGFFTSVKIKEKNQIKNIFIWDEKVKEIQQYKSGDLIIFERVDYKNKNGIIENHVNSNSIIKKKLVVL